MERKLAKISSRDTKFTFTKKKYEKQKTFSVFSYGYQQERCNGFFYKKVYAKKL